jgi:hypothetical protein
MNTLDKIKLIPKNKWMKDRIQRHGDVVIFKKEGLFKGKKALLVESLNNTSIVNTKWLAWIVLEEDASIVVIK